MGTRPARRATAILLAGDLLALLLFVAVGRAEHDLGEGASPLLGLVWSTTQFAVVWILAGVWQRAFALETGQPLKLLPFMARSFAAWLMAAPLAVLVRALLAGRAVIPTAFMLAALGFGGLFVLGWRLLFALGWRLARRRG